MGGDSLRDLPNWFRAGDLIQILDGFGVMLRPGAVLDFQDLEDELPGLFVKLLKIQTPLIEISSSDIRRRIRENQPYRYYLPSSAARFIFERHLYKKER
jgi:nicotinate-nucleotide adenylyltransferase